MSILNNLKQGLVLSGGVGSRNGGTVENPFPKTLQILGGRTVLERILYGQYLLGVKDVAITVPARQLNIYIPELKKIQEKWHQEVAVVPVEVKRGGGIESALAEACELMLDGYMFRVNDGKRVCVSPESRLFASPGDAPIIARLPKDSEVFSSTAFSAYSKIEWEKVPDILSTIRTAAIYSYSPPQSCLDLSLIYYHRMGSYGDVSGKTEFLASAIGANLNTPADILIAKQMLDIYRHEDLMRNADRYMYSVENSW